MQPSLGLQTALAVGAGRSRRERLRWTASAAGLSAESGSGTFAVYIIGATVAGYCGTARQGEQGE